MEPLDLLGNFFHQDVFVVHHGFEEAIAEFVRRIDQHQAVELERFISSSLRDKTVEELATLWSDTPSDLTIDVGSIRDFLELVHAELVKRFRI